MRGAVGLAALIVALATCISAVISCGSSKAISTEPIRTELVRLQKQTGLTLLTFYQDLNVLSFDGRSVSHQHVLSEGGPLWGAVSHDGTKVALQLSHFGEHHAPSLGVVSIDGRDLRDYLEIAAPSSMCWSYRGSELVISTQGASLDSVLQTVDLPSGANQTIDVRAYVSSQCFSPDDKQIVYEADDNVRIVEVSKGKSGIRIVARGHKPSWSPDGRWIAFWDSGTYYAIGPSGEDRKTLFREGQAASPLWWSPDSSVVAFISPVTISEGEVPIDAEKYRLRVRRLSDGSQDWIAEGVSGGANYQWVFARDLLDPLGLAK